MLTRVRKQVGKSFFLVIAAAVLAAGLIAADPGPALAVGIAEYPIPLAQDPSAITAGPDGNVWFVEEGGSVGKITPSGTVTQYALPTSPNYPVGPVPLGITTGPDGNLWFTEAAVGNVGRITPSGTITIFPLTGNLNIPVGPSQIVSGPGGALWFSEDGQVGDSLGKITTSGTVTEYSLPEGRGTSAVGIGPDGNVWFTTQTANSAGNPIAAYLGEITTQGVVTEYPIPLGTDIQSLVTGPDGNLWFASGATDQIGKYTPSTGTITTYPVPTANANPVNITTGPDGNLWFTEEGANQVGEITTSGAVTEYPVPTPSSGAAYITAGPDGNMWFTEGEAGKIGQVLIAGPPAAPTGLTAPSPTAAPALSWSAVPNATSYNVYRDGVAIGSTQTPAYTDTTAAAGPHDYYVTAVDGQGESQPSNTITVVVGVAPAITSPASASAGFREPLSFTVTTTGTPTAAITETGALPAGITLTDNGDGTATIAGVPAAGSAGSYPITLTASNGISPDATQAFTLTVSASTSAPTITSANADTETVGVPFSFTVSTDGYPAPALTEKGHLPADITFTDNGDGTATIASTGPTAANVGAYAFIITAANGILPQASQTFTLTITQSPVLKNIPASKSTLAGTAFSMTIKSQANPIAALSESGALPDGLTFKDNGDGTATISGTTLPDSPGAYPLTITAANTLGSTSQTVTLKVDAPPDITSASTANATVGDPFTFTVTATGYPGPSFKKTGTLPKGITWHAATGTFSGTPAAGTDGTYPITVTATNSTSAATQTFTITVTG
jgi:streptogramin lyase